MKTAFLPFPAKVDRLLFYFGFNTIKNASFPRYRESESDFYKSSHEIRKGLGGHERMGKEDSCRHAGQMEAFRKENYRNSVFGLDFYTQSICFCLKFA